MNLGAIKARQFAGDNSSGQNCRQVNLSASQLGGKINKNYLPSLALK